MGYKQQRANASYLVATETAVFRSTREPAIVAAERRVDAKGEVRLAAETLTRLYLGKTSLPSSLPS
jgi:hypothetical protein